MYAAPGSATIGGATAVAPKEFSASSNTIKQAPSNDPASLRVLGAALQELLGLTHSRLDRLRTYIDSMVGDQPPSPENASEPNIPVGGVAGDNIRLVLRINQAMVQIGYQLDRLERVAV